MRRGIIICPDEDLGRRLQKALEEAGSVGIARLLDHYPTEAELTRSIRAHAPNVLFVSVESMSEVADLAKLVESNSPGVQIVAISRSCEPQLLLEAMRIGIREFVPLPFHRQALQEVIGRVRELQQKNPPAIEATDQIFSFLPSKAGVGTSTIALNVAAALARIPDARVLISDFDLNSGMLRFMLKLSNSYSVTDAVDHVTDMDEGLWPDLVTNVGHLDILHAGKLNPNFRVEPTQIRHLIEFMRRNYKVLCFDLSGNLEKYSLEIMQESKRIFLVCTAEIPSLHLAREKFTFLKGLDLHERVSVLLNRCTKRPAIAPEQIEELVGAPVLLTFPNDYNGVSRALALGECVDFRTDLGRQYTALAQAVMNGNRPQVAKKKFIEFFSLAPRTHALGEGKKSAG